jgi:hypothetical protein
MMSPEEDRRLRFGDYELDSRAGKLFRDGVPVKIQPQPLRVLGILLERPAEIVPREDVRTRIWGEATFVEFDQGLNYCIRQIRLALRFQNRVTGSSRPFPAWPMAKLKPASSSLCWPAIPQSLRCEAGSGFSARLPASS